MKRLAFATIAVWLTAAGGTAQAHVPRWHGPHTPGYTIINLRERVAHDTKVAKHADGKWRHFGNEWARFVQSSLSIVVRLEHQHDIVLAKKGLARYEAQIGSYSAWACIHSKEGAWTDSGDPFWGGLQMDRGFMTTYGRDMIKAYGGYANLWHPYDQMIVAERAHDSGRGYGPWPNTARYCGLL